MEGGTTDNLEKSLPVPSVQELAKKEGLHSIPERYIRRDGHKTTTTTTTPTTSTTPLIDLAKLVDPSSHSLELQKLHHACKHWGLFQLINHGVTESLANMRKQTVEFFDLPLSQKKRWAQKPGTLDGYGQAFVTSQEQKLDWNDMIFLRALPSHNRKLEFWPDNPEHFREALETYSEDMRQVAVSITRFITMSLGFKDQKFSEAFQDGRYEIRMNCYPPCPQPDLALGMVPHADMSGITLLVECGSQPGLQVLKDGDWVFVEPVDGAIVTFLGHITEIMSNGTYKAAEHRAVVNKSKERYSIVTFCYPDSSINIGPSKQLIQSGTPPLYKTIGTIEEYFQLFYNRKLETSFIDTLKV
ncbi:hypothetical protein Tsubulata_037238 [Turnera subulata]|uniref:Fe2OG dioxygenase domain-containing protein n=1 Tax=Turnera subulata TaxID=218843 RepID=A0A9Q0GFI6_9ROSI|nr:hypothetical protein Tsubulata_037238 [Turnera subulata]